MEIAFRDVDATIQMTYEEAEEGSALPELNSVQKTLILEAVVTHYCQLCKRCAGAEWISEENLLIQKDRRPVPASICPVEGMAMQVE